MAWVAERRGAPCPRVPYRCGLPTENCNRPVTALLRTLTTTLHRDGTGPAHVLYFFLNLTGDQTAELDCQDALTQKAHRKQTGMSGVVTK